MSYLDKAIKRLPSLYCRVKDIEDALKIGGVEGKVKYTVENYTELLTVIHQEVDNFAFVKNSQGTSWLPGLLGGSYYGKGLYIWTGAIWAEANVEINEALANLFAEHQILFILEDTTLTDSITFEGEITYKNISANILNINTLALDKLEEEDSQEIYPGESFTIKKYQNNDYRII